VNWGLSGSATIRLASTAGAWQQVRTLRDLALDPGNPMYFRLPSGSQARYAELTVYSDTGADVCVDLPEPGGVCERYSIGSSPCVIGG
jgi:hypothetical protein